MLKYAGFNIEVLHLKSRNQYCKTTIYTLTYFQDRLLFNLLSLCTGRGRKMTNRKMSPSQSLLQRNRGK